jgi:hypothetical protein
MNSCPKSWAKAHRKVKTEYHRIVICSIRTRPKRSAKVPVNQPPNEEINKVTVPISPASPRDSPHNPITVGITKLYICTSKASSDQPPKQASIVRRSRPLRSFAQASIAFPPGFAPGGRQPTRLRRDLKLRRRIRETSQKCNARPRGRALPRFQRISEG